MIKLLYPGGGSFIASAADSATVKLSPQSNSGESGTATVNRHGERQTKVELEVTGASGSQPVHIHKGTCAQLDPKPTSPLSGDQRKVGDLVSRRH